MQQIYSANVDLQLPKRLHRPALDYRDPTGLQQNSMTQADLQQTELTRLTLAELTVDTTPTDLQ